MISKVTNALQDPLHRRPQYIWHSRRNGSMFGDYRATPRRRPWFQPCRIFWNGVSQVPFIPFFVAISSENFRINQSCQQTIKGTRVHIVEHMQHSNASGNSTISITDTEYFSLEGEFSSFFSSMKKIMASKGDLGEYSPVFAMENVGKNLPR